MAHSGHRHRHSRREHAAAPIHNASPASAIYHSATTASFDNATAPPA
ncbi:MAG: hypothetical protein AMXMBFR67_26600 [Nitrospira sp.]